MNGIRHRLRRAGVAAAIGTVIAVLAVSTIRLGYGALGAAAAPEVLAAPPATPQWPAPALVAQVKDLVKFYYGQRVTDTTVYNTHYELRAPEYEIDKHNAVKDPDSLLEYSGGPGTGCRGAVGQAAVITCTGYRLASTFNLPTYAGGLNLFKASSGYYANDGIARTAGFFAMYHAFAHDHDTTLPPNSGYTAATARSAPAYHRAMVRAYEAHMREMIARMFDTRLDYNFQRDLTRSTGLLALTYAPVVQFLEKTADSNGSVPGSWETSADRANAFAVMNALAQRVYWEWVATQVNGPLTAGFLNLGGQKTYDDAIAVGQATAGSDRFSFKFASEAQARTILSLRSQAMDNPNQGGTDGFWFDADYASPGEWWCQITYPAGSQELTQCMAQAAGIGPAGAQTPPGPFSPFGQYYGNPANASPCSQRAYAVSSSNCGGTNLGSVSEEWGWTFVGGRAAMYLLSRLAVNDPARPPGIIGPGVHTVKVNPGGSAQVTEYQMVTDRLGYGLSGWHGGAGHDDDLEWPYSPDGNIRGIRTLSAGRHDGEQQNGRFSVGENDSLPGAPANDGDTWFKDFQEYNGAIENHTPGPSSLYGSFLFNLVLTDKTGDTAQSPSGLSGSLFDIASRNNFDEFRGWILLFNATTQRCTGVADPADDRCFDPNNTANRRTLYPTPLPTTTNLFTYLWKNPSVEAIASSHISGYNSTCRPKGGVPWRQLDDQRTNSHLPSEYLFDEGGYGAYNEMMIALGGFMRLTAERYRLAPAAEDYVTQRATILKPWYDQSYSQAEAILSYYRNGLGYVPDIENSACLRKDPNPNVTQDIVASWQQGTLDSTQATAVRRAMYYSLLSLWYWWYDSSWLAIGGS